MNRINAAYDSGPDLLIQTIEHDLDIPINHYMAVNFPGLTGMVNALDGVTMSFPTPVKDQFTGLNVSTLGCQVVNGTTALELVRSRHLYYKNARGNWEYDGLSDFSRIQRQDAFFRAVLQKINSSITNPLAINSLIGAAVGNLTIDDTLTQGDLLHIADVFRGLPASHLVTETLPTVAYTSSGGAAALKEAQPYAQNVISQFNAIGSTPTTTTTTTPTKRRSTSTTTTTVPTEAHSLVGVDVLNASSVSGIAHTTAAALTAQGFVVNEVGDAATQLSESGPSEILYGPAGTEAAHTLASVLSGSVTLVPDPSLSSSTVELLIAGSPLTVTVPDHRRRGRLPPPRRRPRRPRRRSRRTSIRTCSPSPGIRRPASSASRPRPRRPARPLRRSRSGRLAALAHDPPAFPLGCAAPDALTLAVGPARAPSTLGGPGIRHTQPWPRPHRPRPR